MPKIRRKAYEDTTSIKNISPMCLVLRRKEVPQRPRHEKGEDGLPRIVESEAKTVRLIYRVFLGSGSPVRWKASLPS